VYLMQPPTCRVALAGSQKRGFWELGYREQSRYL
jgi:hypothetical protein